MRTEPIKTAVLNGMRLPIIIGFCGLAGSGKSTAADCMTTHRKLSFYTPIKEMVNVLFKNDNEPEAWNMLDKTIPRASLKGRTLREAYQTLGTEWGRDAIHPDIWVHYAERQLSVMKKAGYRTFVFDDVRYSNEAEMIRRLGGVVIEVRKEGTPQLRHSSEGGISNDLIDSFVCNPADGKFFTLIKQASLLLGSGTLAEK